MARRTFRAQTPLQALVVEQALLLARQLEQTADAPDGQVLARVEARAVPAAQELARQAVQATLQAQAERAEKKGPRPHLYLRAPPLAQGHGRPQCPDRRRRRPPAAPLPGLPPLRRPSLTPGRDAVWHAPERYLGRLLEAPAQRTTRIRARTPFIASGKNPLALVRARGYHQAQRL